MCTWRLWVCVAALTGTVQPVLGNTADCQDLYVGRIMVEKGIGLHAVVFLNAAGDTSGSYWAYFTGWTAEDRKAALALLTSAKMTGHRVNVATTDVTGCEIQTGARDVLRVFLTTNP
jgi:hypothetical protein